MVPLVPLLLEQFVGEDGVDLSVVDDCLRARPAANRCIFGRSKRFSTSNWLKQHPLSLIAEANHAPVYDHDVVKMCVDLKFQLFGNFLYLLILCAQIFFVCLYTGVALSSPTPPRSYYDSLNLTCKQLCYTLALDSNDPLPGNVLLRKFHWFAKSRLSPSSCSIRFSSRIASPVFRCCFIERIYSVDHPA
jgi:hypothetical protein